MAIATAEQLHRSPLAFTRGMSERRKQDVTDAFGYSITSAGFLSLATISASYADFFVTYGLGSAALFMAAHLATRK